MQPYRNDLDALEARHAALEAEVADRTRARDEAARMLDEARARQRAADLAADFAAGGPARRRRLAISIAVGAMIVAGALAAFIRHRTCGDREEARMASAMAELEDFVDETCECKDKACIDGVMDRLMKWGSAVAQQIPSSRKVDERWTRRATELSQRLADCVVKPQTVQPALSPYQTQEGGANSRGASPQAERPAE